jgi:hypothetical protein
MIYCVMLDTREYLAHMKPEKREMRTKTNAD